MLTVISSVTPSSSCIGRLRHPLPQALAKHRRRIQIGARQQDGKLLAADAAQHVDLALALAHQVGQLAQHGVAGRVAVLVVDALEVIDIEQQHRRAGADVALQALSSCSRP
jgi:hypothetical protein